MKTNNSESRSDARDAAVAAATVIMEEFCPHPPGGMGQAIHDRLREIIEAAIISWAGTGFDTRNRPSDN